MSIPTTWFGFFKPVSYANNELPNIFPLSMEQSVFIDIDVRNIFVRILTDVLERTEGIKEQLEPLFWDNCMANEAGEGLITMLARAMATKGELYLVYDPATNVLRKATGEEQQKIRLDYTNRNVSDVGIYLTFRNFNLASIVQLYSALEYASICSLNKQMRASAALQLKLADLRKSVNEMDSAKVIEQAKAIAKSMAEGRDVMLDAGDVIESLKPDLTGTQTALDFIAQKQSLYLGLPAAYIKGEATGGLGDSGTGDTKAIDRGLKKYFFSIVKPVLKALFDIETTFRSEDFEQLSSSLEALKTFELTSDELLSQDNKRVIINKLFGLPVDTQGDEPAPAAALPAPAAPAEGTA